MLTIRDKQREELRSAVLRDFHTAMEKHLTEFAPERMRVAGADASAAFVSRGIEAARARGLHLRGAVRLWLELMVVLGHDFDTDPQYRALWPELDPAEFPMPFAERLHENVNRYLLACFGPDRVFLNRAIGRALQARPASSGDTAGDLLAVLRDAWPEKLTTTGEGPIAELAAMAEREADGAGLTSGDGRFLVATLATCFGAGVLRDPLYPWLQARLSADRPEHERIQKTRKALVVYARQVAPGFAGLNGED